MNFWIMFCVVFVVILLTGLLYALAKIGECEMRIEELEKELLNDV